MAERRREAGLRVHSGRPTSQYHGTRAASAVAAASVEPGVLISTMARTAARTTI